MATLQFQPHAQTTGARKRGCFTCTHFHGRLMAQHVICEYRGSIQVIGSPQMGCAYWEREPGADDE